MHRGGLRLTAPYSIRFIDATIFELIVDVAGGEDMFEIRRTENGFCAKIDVDRFGGAGDREYVECYVQDGS